MSNPARTTEPQPPQLPALSIPVLAALVAAKIALHIPGLFGYGYFRDELYFLDCARHLDWGYVDCAPLVAVYAKIALPILQPADYVAYQQRLGVAPEKTEVAHEGPLPQLWGDQFGWPELVSEIAEIYHSLPADERAQTGIFASNYGEAGAINLFGPALGLPPAICAHQSHSLWGPGDFQGADLIWLQWEPEWLEGRCASVEVVGEHHHPWGMAEENRPILLCRGLTAPLSEQWPDLRHWS